MRNVGFSVAALLVAAALTLPALDGGSSHAVERGIVTAALAATSGATAQTAAAPACAPDVTGTVGTAPAITSAGGVGGTTSEDLAAFARAFDDIRIANCLPPIPLENFRYNACIEARLIWMAEDPSTDPLSAWGHIGTVRSDDVPSVGCDSNLAGGLDNTGATVASKWWNSLPHRAALYRPDEAVDGICIEFAMTHGGLPNESRSFTRAGARWTPCALTSSLTSS